MDPEKGMVMMTGNSVGDTSTYSCDDGFALSGVNMVTCQDDGQWSDPPPICVANRECICTICKTTSEIIIIVIFSSSASYQYSSIVCIGNGCRPSNENLPGISIELPSFSMLGDVILRSTHLYINRQPCMHECSNVYM